MQTRKLQCFAYGKGQAFEAICIDLDISVSGSSFREVYELLNTAIVTYIEDAMKEDAEVSRQLLSRRAPWLVRVKHRLHFAVHMFVRRWLNGREEASFDVACPA